MIAFSIVIPIYNVVPYLRECLDSVLAQTFTDWEAICVDDGSTDGSGSILDEYAVCDRRFRVIHQTNAGVSVARNVGMLNAVGGYITFLDGDDVYDPGVRGRSEPRNTRKGEDRELDNGVKSAIDKSDFVVI